MSDTLRIPFKYEVDAIPVGKRKAEHFTSCSFLDIEIPGYSSDELERVGRLRRIDKEAPCVPFYHINKDGHDTVVSMLDENYQSAVKNWNTIQKRLEEDLVGYNHSGDHEESMLVTANYITNTPYHSDLFTPYKFVTSINLDKNYQRILTSNEDAERNRVHKILSRSLFTIDGIPFVSTECPMIHKNRLHFSKSAGADVYRYCDITLDNINDLHRHLVGQWRLDNMIPIILGQAAYNRNGHGMEKFGMDIYNIHCFLNEKLHKFLHNYQIIALSNFNPDMGVRPIPYTSYSASEIGSLSNYMIARENMIKEQTPENIELCYETMKQFMDVVERESGKNDPWFKELSRNEEYFQFYKQQLLPAYDSIRQHHNYDMMTLDRNEIRIHEKTPVPRM